jgi:hypothetical protein
VAKQRAKKPAKPGKQRAAKRQQPPPQKESVPEPKVVVFFELSGVAGVRFHDEFADVERARLAARALVSSPDVAHAWVLQNLEIIRRPQS